MGSDLLGLVVSDPFVSLGLLSESRKWAGYPMLGLLGSPNSLWAQTWIRLSLPHLAHVHLLNADQVLVAPSPRSAENRSQSSAAPDAISSTQFGGFTLTSPTMLPGKQPVKRLSYAEAQQRREKGLCFYCDEKYTFNHKCAARPKLFLFEEDTEQHNDPASDTPSDSALAEELQVQEVQSQSAISYHALAGSISPTTLRFTGYVHGTPVQVLVDGGSRHNFV
ncbi:hypothetical protein CRG98_045301 [Punica granatum]|uniref:Retrotransposon gag domain-containing protein n=1 Tax=Punica granatum TaxID=22663 RepID=A0A2I0HRU4_PUNGR|nr:hypothetical protein CRG98_045301 [Punica granatum]